MPCDAAPDGGFLPVSGADRPRNHRWSTGARWLAAAFVAVLGTILTIRLAFDGIRVISTDFDALLRFRVAVQSASGFLSGIGRRGRPGRGRDTGDEQSSKSQTKSHFIFLDGSFATTFGIRDERSGGGFGVEMRIARKPAGWLPGEPFDSTRFDGPTRLVVRSGRPEESMEIEPRDRHTILAHYYRAMVGRADTWRTRMDATTNWAIGATAAVVSFALGNSATPHYVVYIAVLLTLSFLFLEARRLTFYHLWQQRVLLLEKGFIRAALRTHGTSSKEEAELEARLAAHLGRTVPNMPIAKAVARRLRRVYLYLFAVQLFAWIVKLSSQPAPAMSFHEVVSRAAVGEIRGEIFVISSILGWLAIMGFALARGGIDREKS